MSVITFRILLKNSQWRADLDDTRGKFLDLEGRTGPIPVFHGHIVVFNSNFFDWMPTSDIGDMLYGTGVGVGVAKCLHLEA